MSEVRKYFDKVRLLDGTYVEVYDPVAREAITGSVHFIGVTTTEITDGSNIEYIMIDGQEVQARNGNVVFYSNKEFIFSTNDFCWHELGDTTDFGALAYQNNVSAEYTPSGTISKPNVTVQAPKSTASKVYNDGLVSKVNIREFATMGSVMNGTANTPTQVTLPNLTTTMDGDMLVLGWSGGSVVNGTACVPTSVVLPTSKETTVVENTLLPTTSDVQVVTSVNAELDSTPTFTGEQVTILSE